MIINPDFLNSTMKVCRTCLQVIRYNSPAYHFDTTEKNSDGSLTIRNKLAGCVPELHFDVVPDPVMCCACVAALNSAYEFKKRCLHTEDTIYGFLSRTGCESINNLKEVICKKDKFGYRSVNPTIYVVQNGNNGDVTNLHQAPLNVAEIIDLDYTACSVVIDIEDVLVNNNDLNKVDIKSEPDENSVAVKENIIENLNCDVKGINLELDQKEEITTNDNFLLINNTRITGNNAFFNSVQSGDNVDSNTNDENFRKKKGPSLVNEAKSYLQPHALQKQFNIFKCKFCEYSTKERLLIKMHLQTHIFKCIHCNYRTIKRRLFLTHMNLHIKKNFYKCKTCSYCSFLHRNFKMHIRTHKGEKPYKCFLCKCFLCKCRTSNPSLLKLHKKEHSNKKQFHCSLCNYSTMQRILLLKHMKNHTGEAQFKCNSCKCSFTNRNMLVDHLRYHIRRSEMTVQKSKKC